MAYDLLTTSGINSLVSSFMSDQTQQLVTPLTTKQTQYTNLNNAYSTISTKLSALTALMSNFKAVDSTNPLAAKKGSSSNSNFVDITATSSAVANINTVRVNQLAKNDLLLSQDPISTDAVAGITTPGTHSFTITSGDGSGGVFTSHVDVVLASSDFTNGTISNQALMTKIQSAINSDRAVVNSNSVTGSTASTGSFTINLNGTATTINYSADTYSNVIDSIVSQINNNITGITATKVTNGSNYSLQLTVNDPSNYITINGDTGTLLSELNLSANQEKAASSMVSASVFSPTTTTSQLSLTSKQSGYDYRILSVADDAGSSALSAFGLNLGATRQTFTQNSGLDTAGFVYNTGLLNSQFSFNGLSISRNSNTISDLIPGATLNLKSVMQASDPDVSLTVSNDTQSVTSQINDFITKFNDIYTYLKTQTTTTVTQSSSTSSSTQATISRGILVGDSSASSILSILSNICYAPISGIPSSQINSLSKLGITFDSSTGLSISNSSQLDNAISSSVDQVEALFNSTSGVANTLYSKLNPYLGTTGYLANSQSSINDSISALSDRISSQQTDINKRATIMRNQYIQLQQQLVNLLTDQQYFDSFFGTSSTTSTLS